jgi:hypothetical protein
MNRYQILKNPNLKPCHAPKPEFPGVHLVLYQIYDRRGLDTETVGLNRAETPLVGITSDSPESHSAGMSGETGEESNGARQGISGSQHPNSWDRKRKKLPWE